MKILMLTLIAVTLGCGVKSYSFDPNFDTTGAPKKAECRKVAAESRVGITSQTSSQSNGYWTSATSTSALREVELYDACMRSNGYSK